MNPVSYIKSLIPIKLKDFIKRKLHLKYLIFDCKEFFKRKNQYCPVCKNKVSHFNRLSDLFFDVYDVYEFVHSIFCYETFNFLHYSCPYCNNSDRNRLYAIYLQDYFAKLDPNKKYNFLDFAPNSHLERIIKTYSFIEYRSADLYMEDVDDKIDITDMKIYDDKSFDFILCSHVLEHVEHDKKAMAEICRVLKDNGVAIIMVPIMLTLQEDLENNNWTSKFERGKYYGQNDHVRMYSKNGFVQKLMETGFKVNQLDVNYFGNTTFEKYGIHNRSVLYTVEKLI